MICFKFDKSSAKSGCERGGGGKGVRERERECSNFMYFYFIIECQIESGENWIGFQYKMEDLIGYRGGDRDKNLTSHPCMLLIHFAFAKLAFPFSFACVGCEQSIDY